jgi:hypothetical protein
MSQHLPVGPKATEHPLPANSAYPEDPLFSLGENAIAKEPGSSYCELWRCVSRLGAPVVA